MTRRPIVHLPIVDPAKVLVQARRVYRAPDPAAAPPVSIATRRTLFGTVGAMLLLTAAEAGSTKAAELDGEMLALCAEAVDLDQEIDRLYDVAFSDDLIISDRDGYFARFQEANGRWHGIVRAIAAMPAKTPEGLRAKAALAFAATSQDRKDDPDPCDRLALSLYGDVLGRAVA